MPNLYAIVDQTTPSGQIPVEEFRRADTGVAAVSQFCNEYNPAKDTNDYLAFDTQLSVPGHADKGMRWAYDFDTPGLVQIPSDQDGTIASAKVSKSRAIQDRTDELINAGAVYGGVVYMANNRVRTSVLTAYAIGVAGSDASAFPVTFMEVDGERHATFTTAAEFDLFYRAMLGTVRYWEAIDEALCALVAAATTMGGVNAIVDTRAWPAPLLFDWDGIFDNDYTGDRYIVDADANVVYGPFAADVPAIAVIDEQSDQQIEGARTNRLADPSAYVLRGTCARVSGQSDPDGGTAAYEFTINGPQVNNDTYTLAGGGTSDALLGMSVFIKKVTATGTLLIQNPSQEARGKWSVDLSLLGVGVWERLTSDHPAVTVNAVFQNTAGGGAGVWFDTAAGPLVFSVWWPQQEDDAAYPSSPIEPGTTRLKDKMSFVAANVPSAIKSGTWSVDLVPNHASTDLATSEIKYLYYLDANNFLAIRENGSGEVHAVLATGGGDIVVPIVYDRGGKLSFDLDFVGSQFGGTLGVRGCTSGGMAVGGTVSDWPDAITLFRGSDSTPDNHIDGRMSLPQPGVQAEESPLTIGGGTTRVWHRGDTFVEGAAGAPDVVTLTNRQGDGYNITQPVQSRQPHSGDVLGHPAIQFDGGAQQRLRLTSQTPALTAVNDNLAMVMVVRQDRTAIGDDTFWEIGAGTSGGSGLRLVQTSTTLKVGARVASDGGEKFASVAFTDKTNIHVIYTILDASGLLVGLDGSEVLTAGTFNGLLNILNSSAMSIDVSGAIANSFTLWDSALMINTTKAKVDALVAYYGDRYGVAIS